MLFNSIWTLFPALPYLALGPRFLPLSANNKIIHLAIDALTALFWFAGFIALAVWYNDRDYCLGTVCGTIVASCVFGAFEWYVFLSPFPFIKRRIGNDLDTQAPLHSHNYPLSPRLLAHPWN